MKRSIAKLHPNIAKYREGKYSEALWSTVLRIVAEQSYIQTKSSRVKWSMAKPSLVQLS